MPLIDAAYWTEHLRRTLEGYDDALLRGVAAKLCKPRNQWPADELCQRCLDTLGNTVVIDRRLQDLAPACRRLLAWISHSRQPRWPVGNLVELLVTLGQADGLEPVRQLLEAGLLYPEWNHNGQIKGKALGRLKSFQAWLNQSADGGPVVFAPPAVNERARGVELGLPPCPGSVAVGPGAAVHETDGLEWPLRLAVLWQQVAAASLRRTQVRDLFKRDLDRLRGDPLLGSPPADSLADLPDPGLLAVALAVAEGVLAENDGALRVADFPPAWTAGLRPTLVSLWSALPTLEGWNAAAGWQPAAGPGNPYPSAYLLALLFLTTLPDGSWARPEAIEQWIGNHHPFWAGRQRGKEIGIGSFLLGLAFQLRLVQAAKKGGWLVRLSPLGRWVLGLGEAPPVPPASAQTLLVQPNLEILAYRQGLTPELILRLTRFATWKSLGPACTLQLQPESVYRALEAGETFESLLQILERHGQKAIPSAVVDALRTWANKRERLSVYPAGALLEFGSAADLTEALARGLPAVRLTDLLAVVANEEHIDYRHFRLIGTRDYAQPAEKCVDVEADGVTLSIDAAKSDLLLETELQRFAESLPQPGANGRRLYRLSPATLAAGRSGGLSLPDLEVWFEKRCGQPLSPAARLLLTAPEIAPLEMRRHLVLHVPSAETADGLWQWPATRDLINARLGPTALSVLEAHFDRLMEHLRGLGIQVSLK